MKVVVSLIKSLGKRLKSKNLEVILAIPPARGYVTSIFITFILIFKSTYDKKHFTSVCLQFQTGSANIFASIL